MSDMDCSTVRDLLGPEGGKLLPVLRRQLEDHVATCERCEEYLALDPVLLNAYARLRRERAPEEVRGRVAGALRVLEREPESDRSRAARRVVGWGSVAVLAAAGIAAVVLAGDPAAAPEQPETAFVEDYVRRATAGEHLATSDPEEVADFLSDRLGVRLEPLVVEGLEVEGAEVCLLDGQLGALIVYKLDGVVLSHYLIPHDEASPREPTVSQFRMAGDGQEVASDQEVNLVTWASPRLEQALMGSTAPATMVRLASATIEG